MKYDKNNIVWLSKITIFCLLIISCTGKPSEESKKEEPKEAKSEMAKPEEPKLNALSSQEKEEGWLLMFDGETTNNWRGYNREDFPSNWEVVDGSLHMKSLASLTEEEKADRSDVVYDRQFENFIFKLEWKISEAGNSGIFYLGQEIPEFKEIWRTAPEMQVLDNEKHPDANRGKDGNRQAGSLYDLIPAKPQNAKPVGQWNQVEIEVNNRTVTHRQNGQEVVQYTLDTPEWQELVSDSKFPGLNPNWANVAQRGYIGLQDHQDDVWFRNLKVKEL